MFTDALGARRPTFRIELPPACRRDSGLTLIELVMFIVIVSVAVVGILAVMNVTAKSSADPMVRKQAVAMGEALLDEILAKDYSLTLPETDTAGCSHRPQYVGVDDYNCFAGPPYLSGTTTLGASGIPALAAFNAAITVAPVAVGGITMKKVTVTVTGGAESIQMYGYRGNY